MSSSSIGKMIVPFLSQVSGMFSYFPDFFRILQTPFQRLFKSVSASKTTPIVFKFPEPFNRVGNCSNNLSIPLQSIILKDSFISNFSQRDEITYKSSFPSTIYC